MTIKINKEKLRLQKEAVEIAQINPNIVLKWATGVGKTKTTIDILNSNKSKKPIYVLLVVWELAHKTLWEEEFVKWKINANISIEVTTYHSIHKFKNKKYNYLILDEAHHAGTDIKIDTFNSMVCDRVIALSATLPNSIIADLSQVFGKFKVLEVTLQEAIDKKLLPEPTVYLYEMTLDNNSTNHTIEITRGEPNKQVTYLCKYRERWKFLTNKQQYPNIKLIISCTAREKYFHLSDNVNYWKNRYFKTRSKKDEQIWLSRGGARKRFLGSLKTDIAKEIINYLGNKRFICFCNDVIQSEELNKKHSINYKKKNSLNIIESFNNKKINSLFAVGMLQEGQNLVDIEAGIIIQLDGVDRGFIQKFGRSLRAENPEQFVIYIKETKDMDYLKNVTEGLDESYIQTITNINEIKV